MIRTPTHNSPVQNNENQDKEDDHLDHLVIGRRVVKKRKPKVKKGKRTTIEEEVAKE